MEKGREVTRQFRSSEASCVGNSLLRGLRRCDQGESEQFQRGRCEAQRHRTIHEEGQNCLMNSPGSGSERLRRPGQLQLGREHHRRGGVGRSP